MKYTHGSITEAVADLEEHLASPDMAPKPLRDFLRDLESHPADAPRLLRKRIESTEGELARMTASLACHAMWALAWRPYEPGGPRTMQAFAAALVKSAAATLQVHARYTVAGGPTEKALYALAQALWSAPAGVVLEDPAPWEAAQTAVRAEVLAYWNQQPTALESIPEPTDEQGVDTAFVELLTERALLARRLAKVRRTTATAERGRDPSEAGELDHLALLLNYAGNPEILRQVFAIPAVRNAFYLAPDRLSIVVDSWGHAAALVDGLRLEPAPRPSLFVKEAGPRLRDYASGRAAVKSYETMKQVIKEALSGPTVH